MSENTHITDNIRNIQKAMFLSCNKEENFLILSGKNMSLFGNEISVDSTESTEQNKNL